MKTRIAFAVLAVVVVVASALGSYALRLPGNQRSSTTGTIPVTTLGDLIAGKYPTAIDKQGTDGVYVIVRNLKVLYVNNETDGDWHVGVSNWNVSVFITEITPAYQQALGRPVPGTTIDETGVAYCDTVHQTEAWHGNTCWEIHPVTAWQLSGGLGMRG